MKTKKLNLRPIFFTLLTAISVFFTGQNYALAVCPPLGCNDNNPCTTDSCVTSTVTGLQSCSYVNNTASCTDDGKQCTSDTCSNGACMHPLKSAGAACDDKSACTTDKCSALGACIGTAITCDDGKECTTDTCNSATGCAYANKTNGTACSDDGNSCTTDQCSGETCEHAAATNLPCNDGSACTTGERCNASKLCAGGTAKTCTASDQCHSAGTCNTTTGICSDPAKTNGANCSDGNACTQTDTCQTGLCTGTNPKTCTASDQCHEAGTCNTATGICSDPAKSNGSACSDGNACTQTDTCQTGACTGSNPKACAASDQCHSAGTCNSSTGICSDPPIADGTSCNDGNKCTKSDACSTGTCGGTAYSCDDGKVCTNDVCNGTGGCSYTLASGYCKIDGACFKSGDVDPSNPCQVCDASKNPSGWTAGNAGAVCHASTGVCDVAETCSGTSTVCPSDGFAAATQECRASAGACDKAEMCTGASATCPADVLTSSGTECRASAGACDTAEKCTGASATCPADVLTSSGTECRVSAGACDTAENCTGSSAACPTDLFKGFGTVCRASAGDCDVVEKCTGASALCPSDQYKSASTPCRYATAECDAVEKCTGSSISCPANANAANGALCSTGDLCKSGETCANGACSGGAKIAGCCLDNSECNDNISCTTDVCVGVDPDGMQPGTCSHTTQNSACTDNNLCTTDSCDEAKGCVYSNNTLPCDDTDLCNGAELCKAGTCATGTPVTVPPADACNTYSCSSTTGKIVTTPKVDGTACGDTDLCNGAELCKAGTCATGTPVTVPPADACNTYSCSAATGKIVATPKVDGTSCKDADKCNGDEACVSGVCKVGTPLACNDGNKCNGTESCNAATGCVAGAPLTCSDNNVCNGTETCEALAGCKAGTNLNCDDGNPCTSESCDPINGCEYICLDQGSSVTIAGGLTKFCPGNCQAPVDCTSSLQCSDGNGCNGEEICQNNKCAAGTPVTIPAPDSCNTYSCSAATGKIVTTPKADGTTCGDADLCNGAEICKAGTCSAGTPVTVPPADACNTYSCSSTTGKIVATPKVDGTACGDADLCNGAEICKAGTCSAGTLVTVPPADACNTYSCSSTTGKIATTAKAEGTACGDTDLCNGAEICKAGTCSAGTPVSVPPADACNTYSCSSTTGKVVATVKVDGTACGDADLCNGAELCKAGTCAAGTPVTVPPADACNTYSCSAATGKVVATPKVDGTACGDADLCNGAELCKAGTCSVGTPVSVPLADACNTYSCSSTTGKIVATPKVDGTACGDADLCNGAELCKAGTCAAGTPVSVPPADACNTYSCSSTTGKIVATAKADGTACGDADLCNGAELCKAGTCSAGTPLSCDDNNICTADACDSAAGCSHTPVAYKDQEVGSGDCKYLQIQQCSDNKWSGWIGALSAAVSTQPCGNAVCGGTQARTCTAKGEFGEWGQCDYAANTKTCDDNNKCTGGDHCDGVGSCASGTAVAIDDSNKCTTDTCDPLTGNITNTLSVACPAVDPTNACMVNGACDAASGTCKYVPKTTGTISCGTGACAQTIPECVDGVKQSCDATKGSAAEACDGIDNDCDGVVDNGLENITCGEGACSNIVAACVDGKANTCVPKPDGAICGEPDKCKGEQTCKAGLCVKASTPTVISSTNPCLENYCDPSDGAVKNKAANEGGVCDDGNKLTANDVCTGGACKGSAVECAADADCVAPNACNSVACEANKCVTRAIENCCLQDADCSDKKACNGVERCVAKKCAAGFTVQCLTPRNTCYAVPGTCNDADGSCLYALRDYVSGADPTAEKCDGLDNNCDQSLDEDFHDKGTVCAVGVGECKIYGIMECKADGSGTRCNAEPGSPVAESCDGKDNDCNGTPDDNFTIPLASKQSGVCAGQKMICRGNKGGLAEPNYALIAGYEINETKCDGLDNDCDGATDEDLLNGCGTCGEIADSDNDGKPDICDNPECGNGVVEAGEQCDNGLEENNNMPDNCRANCQPPVCGDGVVDTGEACDDGNDINTDLCRNDCSPPTCGDSIVSEGEACDDGVRNGQEKFCNATCSDKTPFCGDDRISKELGEECEGANLNGATCEALGHKGGGELACGADCKFDQMACIDTWCGDGIKNGSEECDAGDGLGEHQACNANCTIRELPYCGNGNIDTGEECDGGLDCRDKCTLMKCGDGIIDEALSETCDAGARNGDNAECLASCKLATCGDNLIQTGKEQCDEGLANSDTTPDACRLSCNAARCGDGVPDTGEACDDGAALNGTKGHCNASCSDQYNTCGDGIFVKDKKNDNGVNEQCDGKLGAGEHQSCEESTCRLVNLSYCGDGITQPVNDEGVAEQCDVVPSASAALQPIDCGTILPGTIGNATCEACKFNTSQCFAPECAEGEKRRGCSLGEAPSSCSEGEETCSNGKWGACVKVNVVDETACDDGNLCTESDKCRGGACVAGTQRSCDDGNACTVDSCSAGACVNAAIGGCCNSDAECADTNTCTADTCDVTRHTCAHNAIQGCCQPAGMATRCDIANQFGSCSGTKVCGADGNYGACLGNAPAAEVCNGRDDNCDGQTDEGLTQACASACGAGVEGCQNGKWAGCNAPQPTTELCDGKDNDCNGQVDEGVKNACGLCGEVPVEICGNDKDDNCDGVADEGCAKAETPSVSKPEPEPEPETKPEPPAMSAGHSNWFDLPAARAIKLPGRPTDVKVIGTGDQQIVLVSYCNGESCGMATLYMRDFKRKVDIQTGGVAKAEEKALQFGTDNATVGKKLASVAAIVSETKDDFVTYDNKCITVMPKYPQQIIEMGKAGADKKEMIKTDICPQEYGACDGFVIYNVAVNDPNISATGKCPDETYQTITLTNNPEKKGEFTAKVEAAESVTPVEPGQGSVPLTPAEEAFKGKITEKFGGDFGKQPKSFTSANFKVGKSEVGKAVAGKLPDVMVGGIYSIRAGEAASVEGGNVADIGNIYPEAEENYLCDSVIDGVHSTDTDKYILPQNLNAVSMKDYGGPDLMAICQLVDAADVNGALVGEAVNAKEYVAIFYPNLNETPVADGIEAGGETVVDGMLDVGSKEEVTLKGIITDPTDDVLTYTWDCTDASGADCGSELSANTGAIIKLSTKASAAGGGVAKAAEGGLKYPYAIKVTGTDAGGLSGSAAISLDASGTVGAVVTAGPAVETGWWNLGGGGFACSLVREDQQGRGDDMKFIIVIPVLIGLAVFLFVVARLNRTRVRILSFKRSREDKIHNGSRLVSRQDRDSLER